MSREKLDFDVDKEMKHLKKISNKDDSLTISSRFVKYLIEQTERVKQLEETVEDYKAVNKELHQRGRKVRKQNKRYREFVTDIKKSLLTSEGEDMFFDWLENELENFKDETKHIKPIANEYLMRENKRYREALEIIADKREVDFGNSYTNKAYNHSRKIASKALESEE